MKLAAIVVTYFPDTEEFIKNTESYIDFVDALYIWDNTSPEKRSDGITIIKEKHPNKVFILENDKNMGLAYAYNRGIEKAKENGFTHLMTMDQDSSFENFAGYKEGIEKETDPKVGMMTPPHNRGRVIIVEPWESKNYFIQSGCVFLLSMFDEVGTFREEFFIYFIEPDFFYRAKKYGYKHFGYANVNMIHQFGHNEGKRAFFNLISPGNYSPLSLFYFTRNFFFICREYPRDFPIADKRKDLKRIITRTGKAILGEKDKIAKVCATFRGAFYGIFNIKRGF